MPHSEVDPGATDLANDRADTGLAIAAEVLFLLNLLLLPGMAFIVLLVLFFRHRNSSDPLDA